MRLNRKNTLIRIHPASAALLLSAAALLPLLFCSRSDVILDAGRSVVDGVDSALTAAPGRAFLFESLDLLKYSEFADSAFSLPASRDPSLGTYVSVSGGMIIGIENGDTLAAHAQFRAVGGSSDYYADSAALDSAYVYFQTADTVRAPITLLRSDTIALAGRDTVNTAADRDGNVVIGSVPVNIKSGDTCSVRLPDSIAERIFKARKSSVSTVFEDFAFSIADYAGETLKLGNPYIIIYVSVVDVYGEKKPLRDRISSRGVRCTVFESADAEERASRPYSSQRTRRTAVFRVNVEAIFKNIADKLPVDGCEIMNAVIAVRPNISESSESKNAGAYSAFALYKPWPYEALRDSADTAFARAGSAAPVKSPPYNTHDFKAAMRGVIGSYNSRSAAEDKPYIYIYLRPVTEGGVIVWDRDRSNRSPYGPQKIETVFTRSR